MPRRRPLNEIIKFSYRNLYASKAISSKVVSNPLFVQQSHQFDYLYKRILEHVLINENHSYVKYVYILARFSKSLLLESDASLAKWKGHIRTQAP